MSGDFRCRRCLSAGPSLNSAPFSGPQGQQVLAGTCASCWAEWERREVMVINELRLNFMDPSAHEILAAETRRFLGLDGSPGAAPEKRPDPR